MITRLLIPFCFLCCTSIAQPNVNPPTDNSYELDDLQFKYQRCIDIVKSLYEKILDLDHHFSSLHTQQSISQLSNPLQYNEFKEVRSMIDKQLSKKYNFQLPGNLESNPFIAGAHSLIGILLGGGDKKTKAEELNQIACILDFTMQMNS
ncbi:MAG: hypothetical protein AAGK97_03710, partial [Bacteroidota bacterium]